MRRTVLWILGGAGALTALVLVAVAIAVATVDVRTLVGPVTARVKADTGRDITFNGPLDLKLSLEPKLVANDVTLGNAPWGASTPMVHAKRVDVQMALLPLLQRRFEVVEVTLVEPQIALETDATGRANWDFRAADAPATPPPTAPGAPAAAAVIAVGNIVVQDGTLTYRDGATGKTTRVAIDRLSVRSRTGSAPVEAEFRGRVDDVAVALAGNLGPLDVLREHRWPYPVALKGDVAGKPAAVSTKIGVAGDTTSLDALDFTWGTLAVKGDVRIVRANGRSRYEFALTAPTWTLGDAAAFGALGVAGAAPSTMAPATVSSRYLISDARLPLDALKAVDAAGDLAVGELAVNPRVRLQSVKLKLTSAAGTLDIPSFDAAVWGGTLKGRIAVEAAGTSPTVRLRLDGRDLDLQALLAALGEKREVRGGKTALTLDVAARGRSLHEWAASANGSVLVTVGAATLVNTKLPVDDVLGLLSKSVNPWRERDASTELVCAVVRLPFRDGVAHVDRSIALETRKVGVSASGTLDLRDEQLDFTLHPRVNEGIPIDIPQMAQLVRFSGPMAHPAVKIDAVASATTIAKIGAAIGTGGLSVLGTSLLAKATDGGAPCDVALGRQPGAPAAGDKAAQQGPRAAPAPAATANDLGKALGKLFGR